MVSVASYRRIAARVPWARQGRRVCRRRPTPSKLPEHTKWLTLMYTEVMTTQIAVRLDEQELAALDTEVIEGRAVSRSEAVRHGIAHLQRDQRYRGEDATLIELARRGELVYPELGGVLDLPHPTLD
jgi:Arc/MetJ-type ribon-helix-helix transcriptional regulator